MDTEFLSIQQLLNDCFLPEITAIIQQYLKLDLPLDELDWRSSIRPYTGNMPLESRGFEKMFSDTNQENRNQAVHYPRSELPPLFYDSMMHTFHHAHAIRGPPMDWSSWDIAAITLGFSEDVSKEKSTESEYELKKQSLLKWKENHKEWKEKCSQLQSQVELLHEKMKNDKSKELETEYRNVFRCWGLCLYQEPNHLEHCDCWECYKNNNNSW